ncbi:hypothetical protein C8R44DRAFT_611585, partial [Mycena epipterygia]
TSPGESSGIGRKNCGCPPCSRDRTQFGCEHPGECIETAKILIDSIFASIFAKWNPTVPNLDLCEELALTDEEREYNKQPIETDRVIVFDPNYTLNNIETGFRIFASEESLIEIPARRYKIHGPEPVLHWLNISSFALKILVKNVLDFTAIFHHKSR